MYQQSRQYDPNTAMIIELVGGLFGFLGIGYIYVGRTNDGILRLIAWFITVVIMWIVFITLSTVTCGIGFCLIPLPLIVQVAIPIWSGLTLKKEVEAGYV